jgi:hypothetical protein
VLQASQDQSQLALLRQLTKEANEPTCPIYEGCSVVGQGPRSEAQASAGGAAGSHAESFSCAAVRKGRGEGTLGLAALAGFAALVVSRGRRRR